MELLDQIAQRNDLIVRQLDQEVDAAIRQSEHMSVSHKLSQIFPNADIGARQDCQRYPRLFNSSLRFGSQVEDLGTCVAFVPAELMGRGDHYSDSFGNRLSRHGQTGLPVFGAVVNARQQVAVQIGEWQVAVHVTPLSFPVFWILEETAAWEIRRFPGAGGWTISWWRRSR